RYPRQVRRVLGLPGDRFAIRGGGLWRDGTPLDESAYGGSVPSNWPDQELRIPAHHYLVLPDQRGGAAPEQLGWLLGRGHLLARVWFTISPIRHVWMAPRQKPWLESLGIILGPPVRVLRWCWTQLRLQSAPKTIGDDEPTQLHAWC